MSHGSYDLNLGSKRLILAGDIRSRSWPNISDSYGIDFVLKKKYDRNLVTHTCWPIKQFKPVQKSRTQTTDKKIVYFSNSYTIYVWLVFKFVIKSGL